MKIKQVIQNILTADDGLFLTDGEAIGTTVILPESADMGVWREITEAEKLELEKQQEQGVL